MTARDPKDKREKPEDTALYQADAMWEDEALLERGFGEPYEEIRAEQADEVAGLLRHSAHPPHLSSDAFARIGDALFGAAFTVPLERILPSSNLPGDRWTESVVQETNPSLQDTRSATQDANQPFQSLGYSKPIDSFIASWSRWVSGLWQASTWRPVWGLAALGCVFLGVVSVWQTNGPPHTRIEPIVRAQTQRGPWPEGVNPFGVTRDASERLGHVLRYYREQRQDQWIEDLGGSNVR